MLYDAIDHVILPVADIDAAAEPFHRLGLNLFPGTRHLGRGTRNTGFFIGDVRTAFYVELLGVADRAEALRVRGQPFLDHIDRGRGLSTVVLRTEDIAGAVAALRVRGLDPTVTEITGESGKICDMAQICGPERAGIDLRIVQYFPSHRERHERRTMAGLTAHAVPLKRLDHLAAVAPSLDETTQFWTDVLGVPLHGEVRTPVIVIRQFKIGDAIIELLGPATPDSPFAGRPAGLASMTAFEVPDLGAAVGQARAAGFTAPDPAPGPLPGTRVASIPAAELGGLTLQLLEYV